MALDANLVHQIINIGPDEGTITVKEMSKMVAEECEFEGEPIHMPDRPREVKHASCSADKARRLLNYETKTDLRTSIKETVDYIKEKGTKKFDYSYPLEIISDKTPATWKDRLM
jgi:UDP-glucose 4-epimerase